MNDCDVVFDDEYCRWAGARVGKTLFLSVYVPTRRGRSLRSSRGFAGAVYESMSRSAHDGSSATLAASISKVQVIPRTFEALKKVINHFLSIDYTVVVCGDFQTNCPATMDELKSRGKNGQQEAFFAFLRALKAGVPPSEALLAPTYVTAKGDGGNLDHILSKA
jgi:hypothetical protein